MSVSPLVGRTATLADAREPTVGARVPVSMDRLRTERPLDACLVLTLITVIVHTEGYAGLPLTVLGVAPFYRPALLRSGAFWAAVAGFRVVAMWSVGWYAVDNHHYLLTSWCIALALGFAGSQPDLAIRVSARLLIGLCFAFATARKVQAPDFLDGSFFEFILATGIAPSRAAQALAGVPAEIAATNAEALNGLVSSVEPAMTVALSTTATVNAIAPVAAVLTVAFEALLAVAFLWPVDRGLSRLRDGLLVLFGVGTFVLLPVYGFGWLLAALGLAQVTRGHRAALVAYVAMFTVCLIGAALEIPATFVVLGGFGCLLRYASTRSVRLLVAGAVIVCGGTGLVFEWQGAEGAGALGLACGLLFVGAMLLARRHWAWTRMMAAAVPPAMFGALAMTSSGIAGRVAGRWGGVVAAATLLALAIMFRRRRVGAG